MTVRDLIEGLAEFPPDAEVLFYDNYREVFDQPDIAYNVNLVELKNGEVISHNKVEDDDEVEQKLPLTVVITN